MKAFFNFFSILLLISMFNHCRRSSDTSIRFQPTRYYKVRMYTERVQVDEKRYIMATLVEYSSAAGDTITNMFYQGECIPDSVWVGE